jgi:multiphosphoryl transfer protein
VALCVWGEVAPTHPSIPLLVGLSVDELSVTAQAVPTVKAAVRRLEKRTCMTLVERALCASSAAEVRALVADSAERPVSPGSRPATVA